jgi:hypothetical protein
MPGGCALSAHGARQLIVKTDGQTETEKDTYANLCDQVAASSQGFTYKNEKKTNKYLDELDKYFVDHKIDSRIDLLMEDAPSITRNQLKLRCEGIDNVISHGMLASEHKVRPYQTFKYKWSPELDKAGHCLRYWRVQYSDVKNNSTSHKALASCFT